jgi:hypothetical protein
MMDRIARGLAAAACLSVFAAQAAVPLPRYNVDTSRATVSGLSAGAFMANQLGYAYSSYFKGVGMFAGGPYMCAGHNNYTACMYNATVGSAQLSTLQGDIAAWSGSQIDEKANRGAEVYLFVGASDYTGRAQPMAPPGPVHDNGVTAANLATVSRAGTAHVPDGLRRHRQQHVRSTSASPYISNCGYEGQGGDAFTAR